MCERSHIDIFLNRRRLAGTRLEDGAGPPQEVLRRLVGVVLRLDAEPVALRLGQLEPAPRCARAL